MNNGMTEPSTEELKPVRLGGVFVGLISLFLFFFVAGLLLLSIRIHRIEVRIDRLSYELQVACLNKSGAAPGIAVLEHCIEQSP